jgi:hypothetical protein
VTLVVLKKERRVRETLLTLEGERKVFRAEIRRVLDRDPRSIDLLAAYSRSCQNPHFQLLKSSEKEGILIEEIHFAVRRRKSNVRELLEASNK